MAFSDEGFRVQHKDGRWFWHYQDRVLPEISGSSDAGLPGATLDANGNLVVTNSTNPADFNSTIPGGFPNSTSGNPLLGQQTSTPPGQPAPRFWTEEQVNEERERIRREEKDKLYANLTQSQQALQRATEQLEAREKTEAERVKALQDAEVEAQRVAAEAEMSANQRVDALRQELETTRRNFEEQSALRDAIMAKEQRFHELEAYASRALTANAEHIIPELADVDDVLGETEEEIDRKLQKLVERSASIMGNFRTATSGAQQAAPGVSTRAPAMGQEDLMGGTKTLTAEEMGGWSMADYIKNRHLLPTGRSGGNGRGLYG